MLIYTIGHSKHSTEEFMHLIEEHNINCICDVRSTPYSRFSEQFNREAIKALLCSHGVSYLFLGEELGARRVEKELLTDGTVDFEIIARDEKFLSGINRIENGLKKGYRIAIMCTEKNPMDCHRTILIARNLSAKGLDVLHILSDGTTISQEQIEKLLLEKYCPDRDQLSIFDSNQTIDYLKEAYTRANYEIGYRKEDEE